MNQQELLQIIHVDTGAFSCNQVENCKYKERTISYALGVKLPEEGEAPDAIFTECCYTHIVLADLTSTTDYKNDYSGFYHQRQLSTETCDFFLLDLSDGTEYPLNTAAYGTPFGFNYFATNPNLKGFKVEWRKVLQQLGEGNYKIIKRFTISGIPFETESYTFTLKKYSTGNADKTIRVDIVMNGRIEKDGIEFKGTNWKHSLRVPGFFGRREPKFEEDNIVKRTYEKNQISMRQNNEYKFQTNYIPVCLTSEILDFMFFANDIYMNDYNLNNHSYEFKKFGVKVTSNEGTTYAVTMRKARLNFVFEDKFANNIKRNFI